MSDDTAHFVDRSREMQNAFCKALFAGIFSAILIPTLAQASQPISIENLARLPALQSVTMSPDGKHLVGLIPAPKVVTPSGDHMKFIAAFALKADKILAVARQEWTGNLGGCGEGKAVGAT